MCGKINRKERKNMKQYQNAEMEIVRFESEDIVTTSFVCEFEGEEI
jgi:hypothetical protein